MEAVGDAAATSRKRYSPKIPLEKTIFILVNSRFGTSAVGMFKLNIQITINTNDSSTRNEKKPLVVFIWEEEGDIHENDPLLTLKPVKSFFNGDPDEPIEPYERIDHVALCPIRGSPEELYLIPDDALIPNRESTSPFLFNFKTNIETPISLPIKREWNPIAAAVGESVYVLATGSKYESPEPRFEVYHPALREWTHAPTTPITCGNHYVTGYVVLKDKFIVVCISFGYQKKSEFYSYNALSGEWKLVKRLPQHDHPYDNDIEAKMYFDSPLFGEGVVIFDSYDDHYGIIYSYDNSSEVLLRFSYTDETLNSGCPTDYDLSLGPACLVKNFEIKKITKKYVNDSPFDNDSGVIAKVDHNILCVLHVNPYFSSEPVMKVFGSIIQIQFDDSASCTILETFNRGLFLGDRLRAAYIRSCVILQREEQKENRPWKRVKDDLASKKEMDFNSTLEDAAKIEVN